MECDWKSLIVTYRSGFQERNFTRKKGMAWLTGTMKSAIPNSWFSLQLLQNCRMECRSNFSLPNFLVLRSQLDGSVMVLIGFTAEVRAIRQFLQLFPGLSVTVQCSLTGPVVGRGATEGMDGMDGWDGWMGWMDGWMDEWMDGWGEGGR